MLNRTPTAYALNLIEDARQSGQNLLKGLNITQMELIANQDMAFDDFSQVVDAYESWTTDLNWGFHLGKKLGITAHGALGVCALSANTVGEGLEVLCKYIATRSCSINAEFTYAGFGHGGGVSSYRAHAKTLESHDGKPGCCCE